MVSRLHANRNVGDFVIDPLFGIRQRLVAEDHLSVALIGDKVVGAVLANKPAEPPAHIQESIFRP
ncbi:hypothetical protein SDC9_185652 [bioreactor metagenome]|uniref:Uncharacterized protein n=1 Tax=bioreactor metagenome TaxID=1076179 RepID=A0A645HGG0_9ZZZZ